MEEREGSKSDKMQFPDTNLCGQLFNDAFRDIPLLEKYSPYGTSSYPYEGCTKIRLFDSSDKITIQQDAKNRIKVITYKTSIKKTFEELHRYIASEFKEVNKRTGFAQYSYGMQGDSYISILLTNIYVNEMEISLQFTSEK